MRPDRLSNSSPPAPAGLHEAAAPLALLGVLGGGALVMGATCVASAAASAPGFEVPGYGTPMLRALIAATGTSLDPLIGPDGDRWVFWALLGLMALPVLAGITAIVWLATERHARIGAPRASLAGRRDYQDMRGKGAQKRARNLRPSLGEGPVAARDLGVRLGRTERGDELYASEEDVTLTIAGPRSNKTSAMVVPAILTATGPVITTSNKIDAYTLTVALRRLVGKVFVLDPQCMTGVGQTWWWNPLRGITDTATAKRLVDHFMATVGGGNDRADPYFTPAAERLLSQLVLAAAICQGSLRDVQQWLVTQDREPIEILTAAKQVSTAAGLTGLLDAPEGQRGGVFETALTALACLESEAVARYVTPPWTWTEPPTDPTAFLEFDPWRFLIGYDAGPDGAPSPHDTLYALTREGAGTAAPVVAALVDALFRTAADAATAQGGRLDPPLRAVLDEAANICPIRNLPDLYSYFGSMSIQVMTFLQSDAQGIVLWGREGMAKLITGATVFMVGAGAHGKDFCEDISALVGEHDVPTWSDQRGRGGSSNSRSYRRERILSAADISALSKEHAVLICSGRRPGLIRLMPWYTEPDAATISGNATHEIDQVRRAAIAALGPANALTQHLARTADTGYATR